MTPSVGSGLSTDFSTFVPPPDTIGGFTPALDSSSGGIEGTVATGASPALYPSGSTPVGLAGPAVSGLDLNAAPAAKWFGGVPAGWLGIGFVSAGFMGLGLKRMREAVLDSDRVVKCPLASGG